MQVHVSGEDHFGKLGLLYRYSGLFSVTRINIRPNSRRQSERDLYPPPLRPGVARGELEQDQE